MSEHERRSKGTSPGESGEDAREERLRSLYQAVYPPEFPPVKASEALRRRVTEAGARSAGPVPGERQSARPVRRWRGWTRPIRLAPVAGVLAAALLFAVVALTLGRLNRPAAILTQTPTPLKRGTPPTRDGGVSRLSGLTDALSRPNHLDHRRS